MHCNPYDTAGGARRQTEETFLQFVPGTCFLAPGSRRQDRSPGPCQPLDQQWEQPNRLMPDCHIRILGDYSYSKPAPPLLPLTSSITTAERQCATFSKGLTCFLRCSSCGRPPDTPELCIHPVCVILRSVTSGNQNIKTPFVAVREGSAVSPRYYNCPGTRTRGCKL
jgi:hypothetical protein